MRGETPANRTKYNFILIERGLPLSGLSSLRFDHGSKAAFVDWDPRNCVVNSGHMQ
jgi:hypothetical protein